MSPEGQLVGADVGRRPELGGDRTHFHGDIPIPDTGIPDSGIPDTDIPDGAFAEEPRESAKDSGRG